jgi:hypothetical protein
MCVTSRRLVDEIKEVHNFYRRRPLDTTEKDIKIVQWAVVALSTCIWRLGCWLVQREYITWHTKHRRVKLHFRRFITMIRNQYLLALIYYMHSACFTSLKFHYFITRAVLYEERSISVSSLWSILLCPFSYDLLCPWIIGYINAFI